MQIEYKKKLAKNLANVVEGEASGLSQEQSEYFDRLFSKNKEPMER
jgi:hypothetical protein